MKFAVVVFPGQQLRPRRVSRGDGRCSARRPSYVWHKDTDLKGADVVDPARRVRARRLPAHRRDGALLADHARGARRSPSAAARCSASATAFRSCSKRGCCRARCCATAALKFRCEHVHVRVEQTDTPFTCACRAGPGAADSDRPRRRQLLRAARRARAARSQPAGHLPLHDAGRRASTTSANPNGSVARDRRRLQRARATSSA